MLMHLIRVHPANGVCFSFLACQWGCFNTYVESQWQISYGKGGREWTCVHFRAAHELFLGQGLCVAMFFFHVFEPQMDEDNPTTTASTESNMTPLWFTRGGTHNVGRVCVLNVHLWLSIREPVAFSRRINSVFWARSRSMTQVTWTEPVAVLPCSCRSDSL